MSYTRRFRKNITVYYSGYTSYPPSENGGRTHYSGETTETVEFEVMVDTDPFDDSIDQMKGRVDLLTGSIVATEAAQVAQVRENSRNISKTIVDGFFKTVRSDISQQIVMLKNKSESLLTQLHELAKRCKDKTRVMTVDYERISSRYAKIFQELNKELENRIYSIDEPVFKATDRMGHIDSSMAAHVAVPAVHSGENARLHSKIAMAHAKKEATHTINKAKRFLDVQYQTDSILNRCLHDGGDQAVFSVPYCVLEAVDANGDNRTELYRPEMLKNANSDYLVNSALNGKTQNPAGKEVTEYFNNELASVMAENPSDHDVRVARMADKLFKAAIS